MNDDDEAEGREGRDYVSADVKLLVAGAVLCVLIMLARWAWLVR